MAISSYLCTLTYGASAPTTAVRIKTAPSVLGQRSALETTDLSDDAQTYIPGIRQQAETFDFTANYDAEVYETLNALSEVQKCKLAFKDGSNYTWDGFISASVNDVSVDSVVEMTISITPTTVPVWAKSST